MSDRPAEWIVQRVVEQLGDEVLKQSCVPEDPWQCFPKGFHCRTLLEIGTNRGVSAVVWLGYAESVISIDIHEHTDRRRVVAALPPYIANKIAYVVVPDNHAKQILIRNLNFDVAFVDGDHGLAQVELDMWMVQRCGLVLFHDYPTCGGHGGVGAMLEDVQGGQFKQTGRFAVWMSDEVAARTEWSDWWRSKE